MLSLHRIVTQGILNSEVIQMRTVNEYIQATFGEKLYKISLDGGFTCPNRDGTCGTRGCTFCSAGGSGEFAEQERQGLDVQIESAKRRIAGKYRGNRYIAYFQAYTNTYAPVEILKRKFWPVLEREDIAALSIATRPDCLPDETIELIDRMNAFKPVWIELGLQTMHDHTAKQIRRGYPLEVFDDAMLRLSKTGVHRIVHVILGLPGETREEMLQTTRHVVCSGAEGIKLQLLHVLKGTDLAEEYAQGKFNTLSMEEYISILSDCLNQLPRDMVVHRMTGDGDKRLLIAPQWSADKKRVLNAINSIIRKNRPNSDYKLK